MSTKTNFVPMERIERAILFIRGHKVMLSPELAGLYHVEPRILIQAVKRNLIVFLTTSCFSSPQKSGKT